MKAETMKEVPSIEMVLRCKNSVAVAAEEEPKGEKKTVQGDNQVRHEQKDSESEEEKENKIELVELVLKLQKECRIAEDCQFDVVSRSPMRTQECHHYCKPYEYPHCTSRSYGGVTRVVESERAEPSFRRTGYHHLGHPFHGASGTVTKDIDLRDVSQWVSLCERDPKFLQEFLMDCKNELTAKEISSPLEYRSSRNECSNVSSQFTTPAQSPSEQNLTSPESLIYEESSLYSKSPNIPSLDPINIKVGEEDRQSSPSVGCGKDAGSEEGDKNRGHESSSNIGTVLLKLAEDESTIDLYQFANVCETQSDSTSLAATPERDALNEKLDPRAKENAWARISQVNLDLLGEGDKDGDTQLMILLVSETEKILEYVYVIVERLLKENPQYLSYRNELNQDALYLAAFKLVWEPLVASYIAEALVRGRQDVNTKYEEGNTLLHCLAKQGDSHAKVLERLLKLRHPNRVPVFDVNKKNNRGFTPLHIACEVHRRDALHTYHTVRVLLENGADPAAKDYKDENTAVHTLINESCDVELLRILLEISSKLGSTDGAPLTTVINRQGNTALHLACGRNTLCLSHQKDVIGLLLRHGAMIQLKNINGCVPSVLVDTSRKQEIKTVLHSHRQKY